SRRAPTSGTGSRLRNSRSNLEAGVGSKQLLRTATQAQMVAFANILVGGVFHAAVLFLVAAGLQLVFGVQKIVNLACGSFYALGAFFGVSFVGYASTAGLSPWLIMPALVIAGLLLGFVGPPIERLLRTVYS